MSDLFKSPYNLGSDLQKCFQANVIFGRYLQMVAIKLWKCFYIVNENSIFA